MNQDKVRLIFILPDKTQKEVFVNEGDTILDVAQHYDLPLEGACGGSLACATCHVSVDLESYNKLPEISDLENEMLDTVPNISATSRLGCQVQLTKEMDGMVVFLLDSCNFCQCK